MNTLFLLSKLFLAINFFTVACVGIDVQVGAEGLRFSPETVTGQPGETVNFHFHGATHTASEATGKLNDPCDTGGGFDSGVRPDGSVFSITISSQNSIYVYCAPHCKMGMVMIVNPGPSDSVEDYRKVAGGGSVPSSSGGTPSDTVSSSPSAGQNSTTAGSSSAIATTKAPASANPTTSSNVSPPASTSTPSSATSIGGSFVLLKTYVYGALWALVTHFFI